MDVLDGNAIAGALFDVFGHEMTSTLCICAGCGHNQAVGQTTVYLGGPGIVVRCASCENVMMVVVDRRGIACVDLMGISAMAAPPPGRDAASAGM